jgi:hypothetical protein
LTRHTAVFMATDIFLTQHIFARDQMNSTRRREQLSLEQSRSIPEHGARRRTARMRGSDVTYSGSGFPS